MLSAVHFLCRCPSKGQLCLENPGTWWNLRSHHNVTCCLQADRAHGPGCGWQGRPICAVWLPAQPPGAKIHSSSATPRSVCHQPWKMRVLAGGSVLPLSGHAGLEDLVWFSGLGPVHSLFSIEFCRVTGWPGCEDPCPAHSDAPVDSEDAAVTPITEQGLTETVQASSVSQKRSFVAMCLSGSPLLEGAHALDAAAERTHASP